MLTQKTLQQIVEKLDLPKENILTTREAARRWGVHIRTMQRWVLASRAKAGFYAGYLLVNTKSLETWLLHRFKPTSSAARKRNNRPHSHPR
ncbi:MAG TPA: hypothetical protein VN673_15365 [Clostridia bacterium]|nr:hypothetical protein [Clostridia bacterium]